MGLHKHTKKNNGGTHLWLRQTEICLTGVVATSELTVDRTRSSLSQRPKIKSEHIAEETPLF